jgi:hypothetical protein
LAKKLNPGDRVRFDYVIVTVNTNTHYYIVKLIKEKPDEEREDSSNSTPLNNRKNDSEKEPLLKSTTLKYRKKESNNLNQICKGIQTMKMKDD